MFTMKSILVLLVLLYETCSILRHNKNGGLIVISKDSELKFYSESGEILNAKISKRLLLSIFNKKSPLHDGAVIIHGEKIVAARCILPVSENENLPMSFGMRHRAAYGISEDTDALAIVISEEHNTISVFINGDIKKNLSIVELRSHIVEYLESDYEKKS